KSLRQATVEPVLGTLINYMGLRKINTRGIKQALKVLLLAATAYNLRKLMRFTPKTRQSAVMALPRPYGNAFLMLF
ncbi:transposase, partial [Rufibacter sp. XAAS-G3-1]|uniref:transposase n=1 Tax=Rufibacter sp. XAAS-G3-1 TaxID=2729134 RepID=UPI001C63B152